MNLILNLKKIILPVLFLFFTVQIISAQEQKININDILNKMEQANAAISDLQFNYNQEVAFQSAGEKEISSGEIKYKDKNHIYMHKNPPSEQYIYINGSKITTYVPENRQAIVENWKNILNNDSVLFMIIDFNKNWRNFKKNHIIKYEYETENSYVLSVKSNNPSVKWQLFVELDKVSYRIDKTSYCEGDTTINIKFAGYKFNNNFDENTFKFKPSKDIDIIDF